MVGKEFDNMIGKFTTAKAPLFSNHLNVAREGLGEIL